MPKYYFEDKEIAEVKDSEVAGYKRITLLFPAPKTAPDGGTDLAENIDVPEWELEAVKTEIPTDASYSRNARAIVTVDAIYDVLKEKDIRVDELSFILQKLLGKCKGVEEQVRLNTLKVTQAEDVRISHWENLL